MKFQKCTRFTRSEKFNLSYFFSFNYWKTCPNVAKQQKYGFMSDAALYNSTSTKLTPTLTQKQFYTVLIKQPSVPTEHSDWTGVIP